MAEEEHTPSSNTNSPAELPSEPFTPPPMDEPVDPETPESTPDESQGQEGRVLPPAPSHQRGRLKRLGDWFALHKKTSMLLTLVVVLALLGGVPFTRYKLVGLVWKQNFQVTVRDQQTNAVVSSADVTLGGKHATTDKDGRVSFKAKPGPATLQVTKRYYQASTKHTTVPILKQKSAYQAKLQATGRQVPVTVTNKITGKPVVSATITAAGTEAKTDKNGKATMVLPADKKTVDATVTANGFNKTSGTIAVSVQTLAANTLKMTPSGTVYFLSNKSGKIDVVKTNLDGTNRQTVLAGTGNEQQTGTVLLASRDWKYLVLESIRDTSGKPKLYLINTATDKLTTMDEGDADFRLVGWYNHYFVYSVTRTNLKFWEANRQALKSYNAESGQLNVLDQTQASGDATKYGSQSFDNFYILPNAIVYSTSWSWVIAPDPTIDGKTDSIRSVNANGQGKKDYKTFDPLKIGYLAAKLYEPGGLFFGAYPRSGDAPTFYEYEDGAVNQTNAATPDTFNKAYPTYLVSPSANQVFWGDQRDGKNALLVGDKDAKNAKQLGLLSDYSAYGWYTDNYVLVSKRGSELAIMPASGGTPYKITDYYKPFVNFTGYGYGYGGL
jgi:hypothetical protein